MSLVRPDSSSFLGLVGTTSNPGSLSRLFEYVVSHGESSALCDPSVNSRRYDLFASLYCAKPTTMSVDRLFLRHESGREGGKFVCPAGSHKYFPDVLHLCLGALWPTRPQRVRTSSLSASRPFPIASLPGISGCLDHDIRADAREASAPDCAFGLLLWFRAGAPRGWGQRDGTVTLLSHVLWLTGLLRLGS